jgi:hypothetical protein
MIFPLPVLNGSRPIRQKMETFGVGQEQVPKAGLCKKNVQKDNSDNSCSQTLFLLPRSNLLPNRSGTFLSFTFLLYRLSILCLKCLGQQVFQTSDFFEIWEYFYTHNEQSSGLESSLNMKYIYVPHTRYMHSLKVISYNIFSAPVF